MAKAREPMYRIKQSKGRRPSFSLERDGKNIGELKFQNKHGSKSTASLDGKTFHFSRQKGLKKDIGVRRHDNFSSVASFSADILSRGTLTLDGASYRWAPLNGAMTTWVWYDSSGEEVLRINKDFHLFMENGKVYGSKNHVSDETVKVLALLGWYLILLGQQDILDHLFVSLEIYLRKRINKPLEIV